jgi:hypothetical protein
MGTLCGAARTASRGILATVSLLTNRCMTTAASRNSGAPHGTRASLRWALAPWCSCRC